MNKRLLKDLLRVPTATGRETLMLEWLMEYFKATNCVARRDPRGNIYVTKGVAVVYPCVAAHTDTVHEPTNVIIHEEGDRLFATDWTEEQVGCGGDDKSGIYLCLQMLEQLPICKAAFFVSEENGCHGSRHCLEEWFLSVGYVLEFDSPCDDILTFTCDGTQLFPTQGPFFEAIWPQLQKFGATNWQHHPYTDVSVLKRKFDFPCLNLPAGYFRMHSRQEYVQMSVVENSLNLGMALVEALGNKCYVFKAVTTNGYDVKTPVPVSFLKTHDFGDKPTATAITTPKMPPKAGRAGLASRLSQLNNPH
jgi:hypothetical protein